MSKELFDLTTPQKAIITMEQFYPGTSMNNIVGKITIHEKVNFAGLNKAIHIFVKNTDNIRYRFRMDQDNVKQYKTEYEPFKIEHITLNTQNEEEECNKIARTPFELYDMPLFRFVTFENEQDSQNPRFWWIYSMCTSFTNRCMGNEHTYKSNCFYIF